MFSRKNIAEVTAELLGAGFFTYALLAALTKGSLPAAWAAGLAVAVGIFWFGRISGAHFNPAVTIGFWTAGKIKTLKGIAFIAAQVLGAFAAVQLFQWVTGSPLHASSPDFKSAGLVSEMLGMFIWAFAVAAVVYRKYLAGLAAAAVGLAVVLGVLVGGANAVGFLNPATALTVLGVGSGVWGIYVVGPVVGAIVAVNLYALLFDDERASFRTAVKAAEASVTARTKKAAPAKKTAAKKPAAKKRATRK